MPSNCHVVLAVHSKGGWRFPPTATARRPYVHSGRRKESWAREADFHKRGSHLIHSNVPCERLASGGSRHRPQQSARSLVLAFGDRTAVRSPQPAGGRRGRRGAQAWADSSPQGCRWRSWPLQPPPLTLEEGAHLLPWTLWKRARGVGARRSRPCSRRRRRRPRFAGQRWTRRSTRQEEEKYAAGRRRVLVCSSYGVNS